MCFTTLLLKGPINSTTTHHFHIYKARKKTDLCCNEKCCWIAVYLLTTNKHI